MTKKAVEDVYPLTPLQEGLLFHTLLAPSGGAYHDQFSAILRGPLDPNTLARAWRSVAANHAIFRTAFAWQTGKSPLQVVGRRAETPFVVLDWREIPAAAQAERRATLMADDVKQGFDPSKAPLTRITLVRLEETTWFLLWSRHHLLLDGWSVSLVLREWLTTYQALLTGQPAPLSAAPPFRNYLGWLQKQDGARAEAFWRRELGDISQPTPLGLALPAEGSPTDDDHGEREVVLSPEASEAIRALARAARVTPATVFQGAWALLLARLGGERDIVFGTTVSGRPADLPGAEAMVGMFINTLPLRARIEPAHALGDWLRALQGTTAEARQFEATPLVKIQGWTDVPRDRPLFETLLVYENYPVGEALAGELGALSAEQVRSHERTHYASTLIVAPGACFTLLMLHHRTRLPDALADRWLGYLQQLLGAMAAGVERPLATLGILPKAERDLLLGTWNATAREHDRSATLPDLVAAQVARTPSAVAIVDGGRRMTYAELATASDRLAAHLRTLRAGPEHCVGVCLERSADLVIALLAVLKAGAAYVPLDPAYPADRLAFMAGDARFVAMITQRSVADRLPALAIPTVWLDQPLLTAAAETVAPTAVSPANLAYLIYTSGSTGRPKATAIEHRQAVAFVHWAQTVFTPRELTGVLFSTSVCFDLSIFELFVTLASGGKVIVAENALALPTLPARGEVTLVNTVPSAAAELVRSAGMPDSVLTVNLAGEPLTASLADKLYAQPTIERVYDLYGPSEDTTYSTCALRERGGPATIGRVIANSRLYLLDPDLQPVPVGAIGELWLAGEGLARGYLGRPDLTADRFLPDPFSPEPGGRLYRTGDLARFRTDGQIEFLGRGDHQVKIRGFRIELGEIQARLEAHPAVAEAAVLAREHPQRGPYIVAFVATAPGESVTPAALAAWVQTTLPHYMVPSAWHALPVLPRTPNGKLDRNALPDDRDGPAEPVAAPSFRVAVADPLADLIAGIWSEVLGVPAVASEANFFELGGHSLLATQVVARVRAALGRDVPLRLLFDHPDLGGFVGALRKDDAAATMGEGDEPIFPAPAGEAPPLSFAQERMWVLAQLAPDSPAYNLPATLELRGPLDVAALQRALAAVVARHEPLRAVLPVDNGRATLQILPESAAAGWALPLIDLTRGPVADIEAEARCRAEAEARTPFDLATGPLLRVTLLKLAPDRHWVLFTVHHIVFDGWSEGVLVDDLMAAYAGNPLAPLAHGYADFARWQRARAQSEAWVRSAAFWREQLAEVEPLALPTDRERPVVPTYRGAQIEIVLPPVLTDAVLALGRREGTTLFMTLLAAWEAVLAKQSGQDVFAIGTPVAGRTRREWEGLVGLFVNTLALRADVAGDPTFRDLLRRVRRTTLDAYAQQDLPFERVVEAVNPERDASRPALFQVMASLQNQPAAELKLGGLALSAVPVAGQQSKFDLTLAMRETPRGLAVAAEYATDLFDRTTIERWLARFADLLGEVTKDPARRLSTLGGVGPAEQAQLATWSDGGAAPESAAVSVPAAIARQAERTPDAVAVSQGATTQTYRELIAEADRVATALRGAGVKPDQPVGIVLDRVPVLVGALLGVWWAGGAYVPVDPEYPAERIRTILAETVAVLTTRALAARLPAGLAATIICVDELPTPSWVESAPVSASEPATGQLAYLLFTSGSTGKPKGVAVTHGGLANHMAWFNRAYGFGPADVVLQKTPYTFDASVWEFWAPLMTGGRLDLAEPGSHRDPAALAATIRRAGVTRLQGVPSLLEAMVADGGLASCRTLTTLFAGGEALTPVLRDRIRQTLPVELVNLYGPTETTIECVVWTVGAGESGRVPIGRPVPGVRAYVLDRAMQPVAAGVKGELFVGGAQLARGYWRDPAQTAERFLPDPFATEPGARMYRTGDEVFWRADGVLEYVGRRDDQVKVRGFRIELGEVEAALAAIAGVTKAVAAVREAQLIGYLEWPSAPTAWRTQARASLEAVLPAYMVPSRWALLERWPLLTSGKVDRRALPVPAAETTDATAPQGPVETLLAKLWSELLRVPSVGREDNFFALGGDSILSLQVVARAAAAGVKLSAQAVFRHQTLMQLAAVAERVTTASAGAVSFDDEGGEPLLTPIQQWFFAQPLPEPAHWNQSALFVTPAGFDPVRFETALRRVVARHDAFQLRYRKTEAGWTVASGDPESSVQVELAPASALSAVAARLQAGLDLANGPLLRAGVFGPATAGGEGRLLLVVHHLAIDGVSWRWLIEELAKAYADPVAALPTVPTTWTTWTRRLAREAASETTRAELPYWETISAEALPRDLAANGRGTAGTEATLSLSLDVNETQRLLQDSATAYRTQVNDLLLTALAQTLARWTGRARTTIALEGHGREEIAGAPDITRTVGWFTTLAPVVLSLEGTAGDGEAIKQVKEQLRSIPRRGLGFGLLRYLGAEDTRRRLAARTEPELCFNYLGQVDACSASDVRAAGFAAAPESRGADHGSANPRAFLIEVNAVVVAGELRCTWSYSPEHHRAETIRGLAEDFCRSLRQLVAHCVQAGAGGLTPSDFPEAQVSQDDLDKLLDRLE